MFNVFIFANIELPFNERQKAFCVLEYVRLCSMHLSRSSQRSRQQQCRFGHGTKHSKRKVVCKEKRIWMVEHVRTKSCKAKEIVTKNKCGNPDSTNNSLAHPEETLDNETLQATTSSGHNGRGQAKAQTELTCAVSQVNLQE